MEQRRRGRACGWAASGIRRGGIALLAGLAIVATSVVVDGASGQDGPTRDSAAARPSTPQERAASRIAFAGASREEALRIVAERLAVPLGRAGDRPLRDRDVARFVDPSTAIVRGAGDRRSVVVSSHPVAAPGDDGLEPLDLGLRDVPGGLAPVNPATPVHAPLDLSDGIRVGRHGLRVLVAHDDRATGEAVGGSVVYPNARRDTDVAVRATPGGAEVFEVLRSQESPEQATLTVAAPGEVELVERSRERGGGVDVLRDGRRIATIGETLAVDADGRRVPTRTTVDGLTLRLSFPHRDGDFRYPILVDPPVDSYAWECAGNPYGVCEDVFRGWRFGADGQASRWHGDTYESGGYLGSGLYIRTWHASPTFNAGEMGYWEYTPPGNARITAARYGYVTQDNVVEYPTCLVLGIWRSRQEEWQTTPTKWCEQTFYDRSITKGIVGGSPANKAVFATEMPSGGLKAYWMDHLGGVTVEFEDDDWPALGTDVPHGWTNRSTFTLTARDPGTGIKSVKHTGMSDYSDACTGYQNPSAPNGTDPPPLCKPLHTAALSFPPGVTRLSGEITDALGRRITLANGLNVSYFDGVGTDAVRKMVRTEPQIDHNWAEGEALTGYTRMDNFTVEWQGEIEPPTTATYTFHADYDDTVKLWVGDSTTPLVDAACTCNGTSAGATAQGSIQLEGGRRYRLVMRVTDAKQNALGRLSWSHAQMAKQVVPATSLFPPRNGLRAEAYDKFDFSGWKVTWREPNVNADWGYGVPDARLAPDHFGMKWVGRIDVPTTGQYTFHQVGDDVVRLKIDGQTVPWPDGTRTLEAGRKYPIEVEYQEITHTANAKLEWTGPGIARQVVPTERLWPPPEDDPARAAKVDPIAPQTPTMDLKPGIYGNPVPIKVSASDGSNTSDNTRQSGVASAELFVNGQPAPASMDGDQRIDQPCPQDSCPISGTLTFDPRALADGRYQVKVRFTDHATNTSDTVEVEVAVERNAPTVSRTHLTTGVETTWHRAASPQDKTRVTGNDGGAGIQHLDLSLPEENPTGTFGRRTIRHSPTCVPLCPTTASHEFPYSAALADRLPEGRNKLIATATDAAGKTATTAWDYRVDRTPPTNTPSNSLWDVRGRTIGRRTYTLDVVASEGSPALNDTDAERRKERSGARKIDVYTLFEDPAKTPAQWTRVPRGGTPVTPCPLPGNCTLSHQFAWDVRSEPAGTHQVIVVSTDEAGNTGELSFKVTIDSREPALLASGTFTTTGPVNPSPNLRLDADDRFNGAEGSGIRSIEVLVDGVREQLHSAPCTATACPQTFGVDHVVKLATYAPGKHVLRAIATDDAGLTKLYERTFWIDRAAPAVTVSHLENVAGWRRGSDPPARTRMSATDDAGLRYLDVSLPEENPTGTFGRRTIRHTVACSPAPPDCPKSASNDVTYGPGLADRLPEGRNKLIAQAYDIANVGSATQSWDYRVDRSAPVTTPSNTLWDARGKTIGRRTFTLDLSAVDGTAAANDTDAERRKERSGARKIDVYTVFEDPAKTPADWVRVRRGGVDTPCPSGNCTLPYRFDWDTRLLLPGTYQVVVVSTDEIGNASELSFKVTIDGRNPTLSASGPFTTTGPVNPSASLRLDADDRADGADGSGIRSVEVKVDGVRERLYEPACGPVTCPQTFGVDHAVDFARYAPGRHTLEVVAQDDAGNSARYSRTFWIDREAPGTTFAHLESVDGWHRESDPPARTRVSATDDAGLTSIELSLPEDAGGTFGRRTMRHTVACDPAPPECPKSASNDFTYSPALGDRLPEGRNKLIAQSWDVANRGSIPQAWDYRIDRSSPEATTSGSMTTAEQGILGEEAYDLDVAATDGRKAADDSDPERRRERSGVTQIEIYSTFHDPLKPQSEWRRVLQTERSQACPDGSCSLEHSWRMYTRDFRPGQYTVEAVVHDAAGNAPTSRSITVTNAPRLSEPADAMGLEEWFQYDTTETGGGTQAHVNLGTGNLVWHSMPISNPGRGLSTVVNLTYNSQRRKAEARPGIGETEPEVLPLGYAEVGQNFSLGISTLTRINEPLDVTKVAVGGPIELIDADGTHHVFPAADDTPVGSPAESYKSPPGVEMRLRRWSESDATAAGPVGPLGPLADSERAWAATRPDGVTHFFDQWGYERFLTDRDGNTIEFVYEGRTTVGTECALGTELPANQLCFRKLVRVVDAAGTDGGPDDPHRDARSFTIDYFPRTSNDVGDRPGGRVRSITDHVGRKTRFSYVDGYLTALIQEDAAGRELRRYGFGYEDHDDVDRGGPLTLEPRYLERITDPNGGVTDVDYETRAPNVGSADLYSSRRVASIRDRRDPKGRDGEDEPTDRGVQYRITTEEGPDGRRFTRTEVANSRSVCDLNDPEVERGQPCHVTRHRLDGRHRVYEIADPRQSKTTILWDDERNRPREITRGLHASDPSRSDPATTTFTYNANGLLLTQADAAGTTELRYQDHAGPATLRSPRGIDGAGTFVSDLIEHFTPQGRIDGESTRFRYDESPEHVYKGRVRERRMPGVDEPATTDYDAATGVVIAETDEMARRTEYPIERYDLNGLPEKEIAPAPAFDAHQRVWIRDFDDAGNLRRETDPRGPESADHTWKTVGFTKYFEYDGLDRLVEEQLPKDTGDDDSAKRRWIKRTYHYDGNGNRTKAVDGNTAATDTFYNAMDLPQRVESPAVAHAGDDAEPAREVTVMRYDDDELLREQESPNGERTAAGGDWTTEFDYDEVGLRTVEARKASEGPHRVLATSFAYDLRGNLVGVADPKRNARFSSTDPAVNATVRDRQRVMYEYDDADRRIAQVEDPGGLAIRRGFGYDANGNRTHEDDPRAFRRRQDGGYDYVPGYRTTYEFNGRDLVEQVTQQVTEPDDPNPPTTIRVTARRYHPDGQLWTTTSPKGNATPEPGDFTATMTYDGLGNLATRTLPRHPAQYGAAAQVVYTRDAAGNARRIDDANGGTLTNTFWDTGDLRTTTRPSFWKLDGPDAQLRERTPKEMAQLNAGRALPDSTEQGDFGAVGPESFAELLPRKGLPELTYDDEMRLTGVRVAHDPDGDADPYDLVTTFGRDATGRVTSISRPHDLRGLDAIVERKEYDRNGNLRFSYDGEDHRTDTVYDQFDRATHTTRPGSPTRETTETTYDENGNVEEVKTPAGPIWRTGYDALDRPVRRQTPERHQGVLETTCIGYDVAGNEIWERSPRGNLPDVPGLPQPIDDCAPTPENAPQAGCRATSYDDDPDPAVQCFTTRRKYNGANEPIEERDGLGYVTKFHYDHNGNRDEVDAPGATDGGDQQRRITKRTFEGRDLPWTETAAYGSADERTTATEFDGNGNLVREVRPRGIDPESRRPRHVLGGDDAAQHAKVSTYDANNLLERRELPWDPGDQQTRFYHDFDHDDLGRVNRVVGPYGTNDDDDAPEVEYTYFDTGWVRSATEPQREHAREPRGSVSLYEYDRTGRQELWRTRARGTARREVDRDYFPSGKLQRRAAQDLHPGDGTDAARRYEYTYDLNRNLTKFVDEERGNKETRSDYDLADRRTAVRECWDGGQRTLETLDAEGNVTVRRTGARYGDASCGGLSDSREKTTTFTYDALGQELQTHVQRPNDRNRSYHTLWWPSGDRRSRLLRHRTTADELQARSETSYGYAHDGRLIRKSRDPRVGETKVRTYSYDANGNKDVERRGEDQGDPKNEYAYNARDQLVRWTRRNGRSVEYKHNAAGGMLEKKDLRANFTTTTTFSVVGTRVDRSKVEVVGNDGSSHSATMEFEHNELGSVTKTYEVADPDAENPQPKDSSQVVTYDYDAFERLRSADMPGEQKDVKTYEYDALDRRIAERRDNGKSSELHYVGLSDALSERERPDVTDTTKRTSYDYNSHGERLGFQQFGDKPGGGETAGEGRTYALGDDGSVEGLETETGEITERDDPNTPEEEKSESYDYEPYGELDASGGQPDNAQPPTREKLGEEFLGGQGEEKLSSAAKDNAFRFQGHYYDTDSGTYDMGARIYRPTAGRFLVADRFESASGDMSLSSDPLTADRYAFAGGNPLNRIEFDGHEPVEGSYKNAPTADMYGQSSLGRYGRARQRAVRERQQDFSRAETGISTSPDALDRNTTTTEQQVERQASQSQVARETAENVIERKKEEADDGVMGVVHTGLDIAGVVPGFGEVADAANAGLYMAEGNEAMAALSLAAAVPIAGWAATGAKATVKGADALRGARAGCSFSGATLVLMADGSTKPIEQVRVGDWVLATDPETGQRSARRVTRLWVHRDQVVLLRVGAETLTTTTDHPFWNETDQAWQSAADLDPGDHVTTADGRLVPVGRISPTGGHTTTAYNLTVQGVHTYHVGRLGVLVHNTCGGGRGVPKSPTGPGSVPPAERDPQRLFSRSDVEQGLEEQSGVCAVCSRPIDDLSDARGHHVQRHADGGPTTDDNLAVVCPDCHIDLHRK